MFSKQVKTIFRVLGTALLTLANMDEAEADRLEMTGAQYIAHLDSPDVGAETPITTTNTAAQVFGEKLAEAVHATLPAAAAAVFTTADLVPVVSAPKPNVPGGLPVYVMTEKAAGFTRAEYHAQKWTDEALIEHGLMAIVEPEVIEDTDPNVQKAVAPSTQPDTSTQTTASSQPAAPAAPANTGASAAPGAATVDSTGLPWDARIHSSSRTTNNDGTWKKKKGTGEVFYNQIVAELRQKQPAPAFVPLTAQAAPAAPQAAAPTTFAEMCKWVTGNGFTMADLLAHAKEYGIEAAGQLAQPANAALIPLVHEKMATLRAA